MNNGLGYSSVSNRLRLYGTHTGVLHIRCNLRTGIRQVFRACNSVGNLRLQLARFIPSNGVKDFGGCFLLKLIQHHFAYLDRGYSVTRNGCANGSASQKVIYVDFTCSKVVFKALG